LESTNIIAPLEEKRGYKILQCVNSQVVGDTNCYWTVHHNQPAIRPDRWMLHKFHKKHDCSVSRPETTRDRHEVTGTHMW